MAGKSKIEKIKENAEIAKKTIGELRQELEVINKEYNIILTKQLQEENAKLVLAVEEAKQKLVELEIKNGIKQIPLPNQSVPHVEVKEITQVVDVVKESKISQEFIGQVKSKKEKKPKEQNSALNEPPIDIGRLDLRIGKVEDVQRHPDADSLYVLKITCGEDTPRTVCSGLVKYVPIEELEGKNVVLLCNLKPVKMRGITSGAMVMCASSEAGVEVLSPPEDCKPGDLLYCEGYIRQPDAVMNPKKKIFETVAPDLHTNDQLQACYKNVPLFVADKGFCVAKSLKNVPVK